jgi:hypothetical protein
MSKIKDNYDLKIKSNELINFFEKTLNSEQKNLYSHCYELFNVFKEVRTKYFENFENKNSQLPWDQLKFDVYQIVKTYYDLNLCAVKILNKNLPPITW